MSRLSQNPAWGGTTRTATAKRRPRTMALPAHLQRNRELAAQQSCNGPRYAMLEGSMPQRQFHLCITHTIQLPGMFPDPPWMCRGMGHYRRAAEKGPAMKTFMPKRSPVQLASQCFVCAVLDKAYSSLSPRHGVRSGGTKSWRSMRVLPIVLEPRLQVNHAKCIV